MYRQEQQLQQLQQQQQQQIVTTSSASLKAFAPISTLKRQYEEPLGQRLILGVQANAAACYLEGGVESILKLRGNSPPLSSAGVTTSASASAGAGANGIPETNRAAAFDASQEDDFDAFGFLQEEKASDATASYGAGTGTGTEGEASRKNKNNRFGGFFRKVAASTSATLERQMQGLAVRMDKGKNPDLVRAAMYDVHTDELLACTEPVPLLLEGRKDVRFQVPLVVTGSRRQQQFRLKLWLQSGAALLQSAKVAKNYLLGQTTVDCTQLVQGTVAAFPLSSNLVVGGQMHLCALSDPKFPQMSTRSWSLTDPDMSAYSNGLANLPLDQSYVFEGQKSEHWLFANERATESTIVLPLAAAMMDLSAKAAQKSLKHAESIAKILRNNRHDFKDVSKAVCSVDVVGIQSSNTRATVAGLTASWRRPDSIFELELIANESISISQNALPAQNPQVQFQLYPKVCTDGILPGILHAFGNQMPPSGFLLGALAFSVSVQGQNGRNQIEIWDAIIGMEGFIDHNDEFVQLPLTRNGQPMGFLIVRIQITMPTERESFAVSAATDGLVSLVGLESLSYGVNPLMDNDAPLGQDQLLRKSQLDTLGLFFTTQYMEQHLALRHSAMESFQERARLYKQELAQPTKVEHPHATRAPKGFRPSSSRMETVLSAIPFNCHVVQMNLSVVDALRTVPPGQEHSGGTFYNITHGAPSDHARGFGNILAGLSKTITAAGGLRRLEAKRYELSEILQSAQTQLIEGVGSYIGAARKSGANINHIPARNIELQQLRWRVFEAVHNLHHVTWMCAVRRANCFSQALGLAITSYFTNLADGAKQVAGWPAIWQKHGFMVCFEGLLSAAGKELGMIEDASVAIKMLRMVRVVLMPDNGTPSKAVQVASSPCLKWVNFFPSGQGENRHYLLQIGIDPTYYGNQIPQQLRNGTAVQLYPVLFQVGVDIRQWGAHTGNKLLSKQQNGSTQEVSAGGLVEDEDDDVGIVDNDVLVALNFEAFQKVNVYTHAIKPEKVTLDKIQLAMAEIFSVHATVSNEDAQILPIHGTMSALYGHIKSSAGKMNHSILDEAALLVQQLGGGALVFCKSGKDRTAMHVTYKQSQFASFYRKQTGKQSILQDATLIRIWGTRLPICEKNVGQAKYAFNSLQVQFMPEALKPPMSTLAGFKKYFTGEGVET